MTRNLNYLIKLTYDKTYHGYVADVVNLYGCMSQGKTKAQAIANAKKAIKAYMQAVEKTEAADSFVDTEVIGVPYAYPN